MTESVDPALLSRLRDVPAIEADASSGVGQAIRATREWLLSQQHADGYWVGELEGDSILESEYILLLAWMGRGQGDRAIRAARYLLEQQLPDGGWALYPGGPLEISASVKAYFALKITGHSPDSEPLARARRAIREAGGAERVNSFTRYYLALLGIISYRQCPAVPPELMLLPKWAPLNVAEMSAWSRTILVPLSLLWAHQPVTRLPDQHKIDELFLKSPAELPVSMPPCEHLDRLKARTWVNWEAIFRGIDRAWKQAESLRVRPFRKLAIRRAADWMIQRFEGSDGLGAIFPPIIWSIVALRCLGYAEDSPEVAKQLKELEDLTLSTGNVDRLQPCKSPVWDTAIAIIALRDAGVAATHPSLRRAVQWLLDKEVRRTGDWSRRHPHLEPGGWYFEFNNEFYPDIDDTAMVVMALAESLSGIRRGRYMAELINAGSNGHGDLSAIVAGTTGHPEVGVVDIETMRPTLAAIRRGVNWLIAMQSRNGGWGAFDADNTRELLTRVPFADHNAMIDPPTADITTRVFEMFGRLGMNDHPSVRRGLPFAWQEQEADGAWYGRWGVNYLYGTWQAIVGLTQIGVAPYDSRIQRAAQWLEAKQQPCGGWGETPRSYDDPTLRGCGAPTASQTAWALMGLMAAGRANSSAVRRGIGYLIETQNADGTWDESEFTGTGFPKVFYLKYHLYRISFPLMALGRYVKLRG